MFEVHQRQEGFQVADGIDDQYFFFGRGCERIILRNCSNFWSSGRLAVRTCRIKLANALARKSPVEVWQISYSAVDAAYSFQLVRASKAVSLVFPVEFLKYAETVSRATGSPISGRIARIRSFWFVFFKAGEQLRFRFFRFTPLQLVHDSSWDSLSRFHYLQQQKGRRSMSRFFFGGNPFLMHGLAAVFSSAALDLYNA